MLKVALVIDGYTVRTGKHTYTSAWHLSEKTAAANARNRMGLTLKAFVVSIMYN